MEHNIMGNMEIERVRLYREGNVLGSGEYEGLYDGSLTTNISPGDKFFSLRPVGAVVLSHKGGGARLDWDDRSIISERSWGTFVGFASRHECVAWYGIKLSKGEQPPMFAVAVLAEGTPHEEMVVTSVLALGEDCVIYRGEKD